MSKELETRLDRGISKCQAKSSSLMARVANHGPTVANHVITSTLWFTLTVSVGRPSFLEHLQKKLIQFISRFIWAGSTATTRHRVKVDNYHH